MILAKEEEEEVIIRGVRSTADSSLSLSLSTLFSFFFRVSHQSRGWI
jgi:outer membrane lipopolysaccharide assembly protein LptE/RlpB